MPLRTNTLVGLDGEVRFEIFDSGARIYVDGDAFYNHQHIIFTGPADFVGPNARGIVDYKELPYGPYEWIHYRHTNNPLPELPMGARTVA